MAKFKMTWFFEDSVDSVGWSENWWVEAADNVTAISDVSAYSALRAALLLDSSSIVAVRACNVDGRRDSYFQQSGLPVNGTIVRATYPLAGVWDCLLCRRDVVTSDQLGHMFLHIVPAGIFIGRKYVPGNVTGIGWIAKFNAFDAEVTSGTYLLRQVRPTFTLYPPCTYFAGIRRTERRLGRPFDALRGRRAVA